MPDLRQTRDKLKIAIAGIVLLDVALVVLLFSPLVGSQQSRTQEMIQRATEFQRKTRVVETAARTGQEDPAGATTDRQLL